MGPALDYHGYEVALTRSQPGWSVAGAFAPAAALLYGLSALPTGGAAMVALVLGCFAIGGCLHWAGLALLGRLRE